MSVIIELSELEAIELNKIIRVIGLGIEENATMQGRKVTNHEDLQIDILANISTQIMRQSVNFCEIDIIQQKKAYSKAYQKGSDIN